jgi:hypothetical protein
LPNSPQIYYLHLEKAVMSTQEQARSLMMRHQHVVKNRQDSMLSRTAAEVGLDAGSQASSDRK